jgi:hypothetical protein
MNVLMKLRSLIAAVAMLLAMNGAAVAQMKCTVNDPTGTPFNVRSKPNGPILGSLHNSARQSLGARLRSRQAMGQGYAGWARKERMGVSPVSEVSAAVRLSPAGHNFVRLEKTSRVRGLRP